MCVFSSSFIANDWHMNNIYIYCDDNRVFYSIYFCKKIIFIQDKELFMTLYMYTTNSSEIAVEFRCEKNPQTLFFYLNRQRSMCVSTARG